MSIDIIYQGKVIQLNKERVKLPNQQQCELEIIRHPGGAAVVAIDDQQRICLLRQYRHAAGGWLWELPAGKLEPDENDLTTAKRELGEEAGIVAATWQSLGQVHTSPGVLTEIIYLYMATNLSSVTTAHEANEVIEVHWLPFEDVLGWIDDGEVSDAKTIIGISKAKRYVLPKIG